MLNEHTKEQRRAAADQGVRSLEQEFKASLMERRQKNGSKPASQPARSNGGQQRTAQRSSYNPDFGPMPSDDDIPF